MLQIKMICFIFIILQLEIVHSFDKSWTHEDHVPGEPLSPIDFQNAEALPNGYDFNPKYYKDPIELAGLFEGDIILPFNINETAGGGRSEDALRNAITKETQKWTGGIIPYIISAQFNPLERSVIARAFLEYQRQTCISFRPRTTEIDYINIQKGNGCSSHVGKTGGDQPVILGNGCVSTGIATHELMHAIGFWHEQSRWDRDDHINIYFTNIAQGMEFNFRKYSWRDIQNLSAPYDTSSILHYGQYAFSKDKNIPTIVPKIPNNKMGQRDGLSKIDLWKISKLYNCNGLTPSTSVNPPPVPVTNTSGGGGEGSGSGTPSSIIENTFTTTQPPKGIKCLDSHKHCNLWSEKGECTKNPTWMLINCRKSCSTCDSPCIDSNQYCSSWQQGGECQRNPHYMNTYCAKSCGMCLTNTPEDVEPSLVVCKDNDLTCEEKAKNGECTINPNFMLTNCKKSCNLCLTKLDVTTTTNTNGTTQADDINIISNQI